MFGYGSSVFFLAIKGHLWCLQSAVWQVTKYSYSGTEGFYLLTDVRLIN